MITANGLTMQYRSGKGIFDLCFTIQEGETFGYLGPNGAGKTTTIRTLLGFVKANRGSCSINGLDCWRDAARIQRVLGYIPGEIAYINGLKGNEFLQLLSDMRSTKNHTRQKELSARFEIDSNMPIRKMSKGMKQKIGIIAAFMHDPAIYILDEPTNGLDPLMQRRFVDLILEEKRRGKTILMSSHMFEEVERTCERAGIIRDGRLVAVEDISQLKNERQKKYIVTLENDEDALVLERADLRLFKLSPHRWEVTVGGSTNSFIRLLSAVTVENLEVSTLDLEEIFLRYYGQEAN